MKKQTAVQKSASSLKTASIIDFINYLTVEKKPWDQLTETDKKAFSPFMINRWLSMSMDYVELVAMLQKYTMTVLDKEMVYRLYLDLLPKQKIYLKYIKKETSKDYQDGLVELLKDYYLISRKDAIQYLDIYFSTVDRKNELKDLIAKFGKTEKEIKKLLE